MNNNNSGHMRLVGFDFADKFVTYVQTQNKTYKV